MHGEKAKWELHKIAICCFEQIQEATSQKTAAVQPPTNHPNKMNKTCRALVEE